MDRKKLWTTSDGFGYDFKKTQQDKRGNLYNTLIFYKQPGLAHLLKPGTSKNNLKPAKTTEKKLQNEPKRPKMSKMGKSLLFH